MRPTDQAGLTFIVKHHGNFFFMSRSEAGILTQTNNILQKLMFYDLVCSIHTDKSVDSGGDACQHLMSPNLQFPDIAFIMSMQAVSGNWPE